MQAACKLFPFGKKEQQENIPTKEVDNNVWLQRAKRNIFFTIVLVNIARILQASGTLLQRSVESDQYAILR